DANRGFKPTAALEDAEHVTGLADLVADQRIQERDDATMLHLPLGRRRHGLQAQRLAAHAVGLAEAGPLVGYTAVVVEGGTPKHAAVGHHALVVLHDFLGMTIGGAAADVSNAEVARVDEANELGVLVIEDGVRADRVGAGPPDIRITRLGGGGAVAR